MGGLFSIFHQSRPQNHQKGAILHTSQANGGLEPPRPPGYATGDMPSSPGDLLRVNELISLKSSCGDVGSR